LGWEDFFKNLFFRLAIRNTEICSLSRLFNVRQFEVCKVGHRVSAKNQEL
jgi:hypothetical protein